MIHRPGLPSIWSAASGAGTAVCPATTLCGSMPSIRVLQRHLITAMRSGRVKWQEVLSNTVLGRLQTTIGALIICHSSGPPRSAPPWQADLSGTGQQSKSSCRLGRFHRSRWTRTRWRVCWGWR